MTVGNKLHQTMNSLKSLQAEMATYALDTEDQNAKQMYTDCSNQLEQICQKFQKRLDYVMQEEPQYDVYNQQQQQQ